MAALGELQLAIMRVLWARGEASAGDVHRELEAERGCAPTTIATMLRKMEQKGVVKHRALGRQFVYRPTVREEDVSRTMVGELVERLFRGDPAALVDHLVRAGDVDLDELDALRRRLRREERHGR